MTDSTRQWGAPPRQRLRPWHIVLIVFGGMALFGVGLWQLLSWALGPLKASGDDFMRAVQAQDFPRAYALSTPALQRELGDAGRMRATSPAPFSEWSWSQRSIRNNMGRLAGTVVYQNGRSGGVALRLDQIDDQWRVAGYHFDPPR
jgi:hypothetical protein